MDDQYFWALLLIRRLLNDQTLLKTWLAAAPRSSAAADLEIFAEVPERDRAERVGGLDSHLSHFTTAEVAPLFNAATAGISLVEALAANQILYFQLPTMLYPVLGEATGRLVLQCFQSAVARRHLALPAEGQKERSAEPPKFFSCFLDDFQDYLYPGFASLLNKSRSAGVGVVFSHQALGDLDKVGPAFRNVVAVNTNVKVVMRTSDPDTADHFSRTFGTKAGEKFTERRRREATGERRTGDGSVREVEEFVHHPNEIKGLRLGQGLVSIPHPKGVTTVKVAFAKRPDLPWVPLPPVPKALAEKPFPEPRPPRRQGSAPIKEVV